MLRNALNVTSLRQLSLHLVLLLTALANHTRPRQADMFSDFNGIQFEEIIDFHRHEQNWANCMVLGDSVLVMTSLVTKRA